MNFWVLNLVAVGKAADAYLAALAFKQHVWIEPGVGSRFRGWNVKFKKWEGCKAERICRNGEIVKERERERERHKHKENDTWGGIERFDKEEE